MAEFDKSKLTKEQFIAAANCKSADELIDLAKQNGVDLNKEEAEAFLAEVSSIELDLDTLESVSGGVETCYIIDGCAFKCGTLKDC